MADILKKLKREQLLELLVGQTKELDAERAALAEAKAKIDELTAKVDELNARIKEQDAALDEYHALTLPVLEKVQDTPTIDDPDAVLAPLQEKVEDLLNQVGEHLTGIKEEASVSRQTIEKAHEEAARVLAEAREEAEKIEQDAKERLEIVQELEKGGTIDAESQEKLEPLLKPSKKNKLLGFFGIAKQ